MLVEMRYDEYRECLAGRWLPCAFVNMDALDRNVRLFKGIVEPSGKKLRVATKSVRVPWVLAHVRDMLGDIYGGLMCYTMEEAAFLHEQGFDDLFVAYPTVQKSDMDIFCALTKKGADVKLIVDCPEHLHALSSAGKAAKVELSAIIDVDMSYRPGKGLLHLGVRRSPIRNAQQVLDMARLAGESEGVKFGGAMGYEAQIAGLGDVSPFNPKLNPVKKLIRRLSIPDVASRRTKIVDLLGKNGIELPLFNGGGTGSVNSTTKEDHITETTVGSGFFCSHLFSYYSDLPLSPAAFFALQVVRVPKAGMVTCLGGGYMASGQVDQDKAPVVHSPPGCKLLPMEGAGEVQTPVVLPGDAPKIALGDPVIFRHAKAGELAEHFTEYLMIRNGAVESSQKTYRGYGMNFLS